MDSECFVRFVSTETEISDYNWSNLENGCFNMYLDKYFLAFLSDLVTLILFCLH